MKKKYFKPIFYNFSVFCFFVYKSWIDIIDINRGVILSTIAVVGDKNTCRPWKYLHFFLSFKKLNANKFGLLPCISPVNTTLFI